MNTAGALFSSATDDWQTPLDLYAALDQEFAFEWDAAATAPSALCGPGRYYGPDQPTLAYQDALTATWGLGRFFLNPPYSRCRAFLTKAAAERLHGALTVCLVPARTDTRWWHESVWNDVFHRPRHAVEVRLLKGRLKFGRPDGTIGQSAPFPSAVVIFRP